MSSDESIRYQIISKFLAGAINCEEAAKLLQISEREPLLELLQRSKIVVFLELSMAIWVKRHLTNSQMNYKWKTIEVWEESLVKRI